MINYELQYEEELEDIVGALETARKVRQQEKEKNRKHRKNKLRTKYTRYNVGGEATTQQIKSNQLTERFNVVKGVGADFYFRRNRILGLIEPVEPKTTTAHIVKDKDKDIEISVGKYSRDITLYGGMSSLDNVIVYTFFNKKTLYLEMFELQGDKSTKGKEISITGDIHTVNDYLVKNKVSTKYFVTDNQVRIARGNTATNDINALRKLKLEDYLVYGYFSKYFNTLEEVYEDYLNEVGCKPNEFHDSTIRKAKNRIRVLTKFHKNNNIKRRTKHRDHYISYDTSTRAKTRMVLHELKGLYNSPAYKEGSKEYDYVQDMSDEEFDELMGGISKDSYFGVPILDDTLGDKAQILTKKTNEYIWT